MLEPNQRQSQKIQNPFFNPKVHYRMIISLTLLFALEAAMLAATIIRHRSLGTRNKFENIMCTVLIVVYFITIVIYVPLFITVMSRLKATFPEVHK